MVKPFNFSRLPLVYFGPGKTDLLAGIAARYGTSAFLVTGKGSFISSLKGKEIFSLLEVKGIKIYHAAVSGEPSPAIIDDAVAEVRGRKIDVVVAIGGGSAIDAGKAVSAMLPLGGKIKEYLEGVGQKEHPGIRVPFIAVPTTAGSQGQKHKTISRGPKKTWRPPR